MATFSWKRGILHGLVPVVLLIAASGAVAAFGDVADPKKLGEGTGRLAVFVLAIGIGISYLLQTGRRGLGLAAGGLPVFLLVRPRGGTPAPLTASERASLELVEEAGQRRLRHPAFGFSILHPGPTYTMSPEMASVMAKTLNDPAAHFQAWADLARG